MRIHLKLILFTLFFVLSTHPEIKQPLIPLSEPKVVSRKNKKLIGYQANLSTQFDLNIKFIQSLLSESEPILSVIVAELIDKETHEPRGSVEFGLHHYPNIAGYIRSLHILPEHRGKSYGSILLKFAISTLSQWGCKHISFEAQPFNLKEGESVAVMLPKLIAFYQRHGAQLISQNEYAADMKIDLQEL